VGWEVDVVNQFRGDADRKEFIGQRDTPAGPRCTWPAAAHHQPGLPAVPQQRRGRAQDHDRPYGPANGFGWQLNEVVGAQIVSVPLAVPLQRAEQSFTVFMGSLVGVFVVVGIVLNLMIWLVVVRPVTRLSELADRVSQGDLEAPDFPAGGNDEIGVLAQSFSRMRTSVVQAMKMLEGCPPSAARRRPRHPRPTPPDHLGKYRITEVLGEGAMGVVYKGFDPDIQRVVALKTIRAGPGGRAQAPDAAARFRNEAQAAGRLSAPGHRAVYDFGQPTTSPSSRWSSSRATRWPLPANQVRFTDEDIPGLMSQVLDALHHAHEAGVWHRDIKPANIILAATAAEDRRLRHRAHRGRRADADARDDRHAGLHGARAVPGHHPIDRRVDLYSAGVLLYLLLVGKPPFSGPPRR
jgi:HAMP domain-containing protein